MNKFEKTKDHFTSGNLNVKADGLSTGDRIPRRADDKDHLCPIIRDERRSKPSSHLTVIWAIAMAIMLLSVAIGQPFVPSSAASEPETSINVPDLEATDYGPQSEVSDQDTDNYEITESVSIADTASSSNGEEMPPPVSNVESPRNPQPILVSESMRKVKHISDRESHTYKTLYGTYSFNRSEPHISQLYGRNGQLISDRTTFVVLAPESLDEVDSRIVIANEDLYQVEYSASRDGRILGELMIEYNFLSQGPPKISATFNTRPGIPNFDFNIAWRIYSPLDCVYSLGSEAPKTRQIEVMWISGQIHSRISLTHCDVQSSPFQSLTVDWSDAQTEHVQLKKVTDNHRVLSNLEVVFIKNQREIDPLIYDEVPGYEIDRVSSIERRTFYLNGFYWVFFKILEDEIWYMTSHDGMTWNTALKAFDLEDNGAYCVDEWRCAFYSGLDVSASGSTIVLTLSYRSQRYNDDFAHFGILAGTAEGNIARFERPYGGEAYLPIDFEEPHWFTANHDPQTVTIGTNGDIWTTVSYYKQSAPIMVSSTWRLDRNGWDEVDKVEIQTPLHWDLTHTSVLVPLSNAKVARVWAETDDTRLRWKIWDRDWSAAYEIDLGFAQCTHCSRSQDFSVVSLSDDSLVVAYVVPGTPENDLKRLRIIDESTDIRTVCSDCASGFPTASRDRSDTFFVYWKRGDNEVRYWYEIDNWASEVEWNLQPSNSPYDLSSGFLATGFSFVTWVDDAGLWFASWPTPRSVSSGNAAPWKNTASTPFLGTSSHLDESISVANGLLSIGHADLNIPGKNGLDLQITRVFRSPQIFRQPLSGGPDEPYMFFKSPYANMGNGWELGFPWIDKGTEPSGTVMVNFGGGVRFLMKFPENVNRIENHMGLHFTLERNQVLPGDDPNDPADPTCSNDCYIVTLKSGLNYVFRTDGYLYKIVNNRFDPKSDITFSYAGGYLDNIIDSLGYAVDLINEVHLDRIDREGNLVVQFSYESGNLKTITDAAGRSTVIDYGPGSGGGSMHLIKEIEYPTGSHSYFYYTEIERGTDTRYYAVRHHEITDDDETNPETLKDDEYKYYHADGTVFFTRQIQKEMNGILRAKLCRDYIFNMASNSVTIVQREPSEIIYCGSTLGKTELWFDGRAQLVQTDSYPGDSESPSSSTAYEYDNWGNPVYSRDAIGHEAWRSFANTDSQNDFVGGGVLTDVMDRNIIYDAFEGWDLSDWKKDLGDESPSEEDYLDSDSYLVFPPSLMVFNDPSDDRGLSHSFESNTGEIWIDAPIKFEEYVDHDIYILDDNDNPRLRISFSHTGFICYNEPEWAQTRDPCIDMVWYYDHYARYRENVWYSLGIHLKEGSGFEPGTFDLYLNGTLVVSEGSLQSPGSRTFAKILFETEYDSVGGMWIDSLSINDFLDWSGPAQYNGIKIDGMDPGQYGELLNFDGKALDRQRAGSSGSIDLNWWHHDRGEWDLMREGSIHLYDADGTRVYSSPFRVHGGKWFDFVPPRDDFSLKRTQSGFSNVKIDNDCDWDDWDRCILLDEASDLGYVAVDEDFSSGQLNTEEFRLWEGGNGYHQFGSGHIELWSGGVGGPWGGGYSRITSKEVFSLEKVDKLWFGGRMKAYVNPNPMGPPILGDGQPRGLRVGTDGRNAIEFVSIDRDEAEAVTIANGIATRTPFTIPGGGGEINYYQIYTIEATLDTVEFYVNGFLVAEHDTNIPRGELNIYLSSENWQGYTVFIIADWAILQQIGDGWPAPSEVSFSNEDLWLWPNEKEILGAHEIDAHKSKHYGMDRFREFSGVATYHVGSNDLLAQYVYLPSQDVPKEIMMRYSCGDLWYSWGDGAFWGENLIDEPSTRYRLGDLPKPDGWALLLIDPSYVSCSGKLLEGIMYGAYGGQVYWDYSAIRDRSTTQIRIAGSDLQAGWNVVLFNDEHTIIDSAVVSGNEAILDPFDPSGPNIRTYPLRGYFKILDGSNLVYWSHTYEKIWPGDEYAFTLPEFYPNEDILNGDGYQDHPLGSLEFRFGRLTSGSESGPVKSFYEYDDYHLREHKVFDGIDWALETFEYYPDGNLQFYCDLPTGSGCEVHHETKYEYHNDFANAYLTDVTQWADGQLMNTHYWYDEFTGVLTSVRTPNLDTTNYDYDEVLRLTRVTHPLVDGESDRAFIEYQYDDENNRIVFIPERYDLAELRYRTETVYDELGRTIEVATLHKTGERYVYEEYEYNWADRVETQILKRGSDDSEIRRYTFIYDELGRIIQETYPDPIESKSYTYYDKENYVNIKSNSLDGPAQESEYHYDWNGRLIEVGEKIGIQIYSTAYLYDDVGNLIKITDDLSQETNYHYDSMSRLTRIVYPDSLYEDYVYDNEGDLYSRVDRRGITTRYYYDSIHRLIMIVYPGSSKWITFDYDANSNVKTKTEHRGGYGVESRIDYQYDDRDRVVMKQVDESRDTTFGPLGFIMDIEYGYDKSNNLVDVNINPGFGLHVVYQLDEFDRTWIVVEDQGTSWGEIATFSYFEDGAIEEIYYANDMKITNSYYESGLHQQMKLEHLGQNYLTLDYDYFDDGFTKTLTSTFGLDDPVMHEYGYDALNRLTSYEDHGRTPHRIETYTYDSVGNRLTKYIEDLGRHSDYGYIDYNRLGSIETPDWRETEILYEYDNNGNVVLWKFYQYQSLISAKCYEYDEENQLVEYRYGPASHTVDCDDLEIKEEYYYDSDGRRIAKSTAFGTTLYGYSGSVPVFVGDDGGNNAYFVWANGLLIAEYSDSGVQYYHQDSLGNVRMVTDYNSNIVFSANYHPFGDGGESGWSRFQYGAKEQDDSGLYYLGARYYDPDIGRFISEDPIKGGIENPQGLNQYAYALNGPLTYTDPTGALVCAGICTAIILGFLISSLMYVVTTPHQDLDFWDFMRVGVIGAITGGVSAGVGSWIGSAVSSAVAGAIAGAGAGAGIGAGVYTLDSVIEYAQTGTFEWDTGTFLISMGMGAAFGAMGGYQAFKMRPGYWPDSAKRMNKMLGFKGTPVKDAPGPVSLGGTPGRNTHIWKMTIHGRGFKIVGQTHKYDPRASLAKQKWHWHVLREKPNGGWIREDYFPGQYIDDWILKLLGAGGYT